MFYLEVGDSVVVVKVLEWVVVIKFDVVLLINFGLINY